MKLCSTEQVYRSIAQSATINDLHSCVSEFARLADHEQFICDYTVRDSAHTRPFSVHNYSQRWLDSAARIPQRLYDHDPVFNHMASNAMPIVWNGLDYERAGVGEIWEESSQIGIRSGIAVTVECAQGIALSVGLSRDSNETLPSGPATQLMAHVLLFATCLKSRVSDLVVPQLRPRYADLPELTGREIDVLKWTREGKTAWELGQILGITYSTANFHLQNAQRKLASTDKHRAVLKAMELHLLD